MANPFDEPDAADDPAADSAPGNPALLARLRAELAQRQATKAPMYRVVEVTRDARGRLVQQGRIWHSDLDHARRFGRALAGNSVSQKVVVADQSGAVLEQLPVPPPGSAPPSGWMGWRDMPLPPAPPRPSSPQPPLFRPAAPMAEPPVLVAPASAFGLFDDDPVARPLPATPWPPTPPAATRFPPTVVHRTAAPWPDVFAEAEADAQANVQAVAQAETDARAEASAAVQPAQPVEPAAAAPAVDTPIDADTAPPAPASASAPAPAPPPPSAGASRLRARLTGQTLT